MSSLWSVTGITISPVQKHLFSNDWNFILDVFSNRRQGIVTLSNYLWNVCLNVSSSQFNNCTLAVCWPWLNALLRISFGFNKVVSSILSCVFFVVSLWLDSELTVTSSSSCFFLQNWKIKRDSRVALCLLDVCNAWQSFADILAELSVLSKPWKQ